MKQAWGAMAWIRKKDDEDGEERMNPGGRIYIYVGLGLEVRENRKCRPGLWIKL